MQCQLYLLTSMVKLLSIYSYMYMCVNELNDRKYDAVYPRSNKRLYNTSYGGC